MKARVHSKRNLDNLESFDPIFTRFLKALGQLLAFGSDDTHDFNISVRSDASYHSYDSNMSMGL